MHICNVYLRLAIFEAKKTGPWQVPVKKSYSKD